MGGGGRADPTPGINDVLSFLKHSGPDDGDDNQPFCDFLTNRKQYFEHKEQEVIHKNSEATSELPEESFPMPAK